jgi:hypothetical protein
MVAKRFEPKISLGAWMLAVLLADLLCFAFLIAGIEHFDATPGITSGRFVFRNVFFVFTYSHSLLMNAIWAALFATA